MYVCIMLLYFSFFIYLLLLISIKALFRGLFLFSNAVNCNWLLSQTKPIYFPFQPSYLFLPLFLQIAPTLNLSFYNFNFAFFFLFNFVVSFNISLFLKEKIITTFVEMGIHPLIYISIV